MNVRELWERLRAGVGLTVTWDFTPHGTGVGAQWRITRKTGGAVSGMILPAKTPFRFDRYKASEVRIDGPDTYTVLEKGVPIRTFEIDDSGARHVIYTATDLLRSVLKTTDGDAIKAGEALRRSGHPETRSAAGILRRALDRKRGATHVRYTGGGGFDAEDPRYFVDRVDDAACKIVKRIGPWDTEAYGPFKPSRLGYGSRELDELRRVLAPHAHMLRVVNHVGCVVATSPSVYRNDGSFVREAWEQRSA